MKTPPLPGYYTTLRPFRDLFATGTPILTYHKLGPRPSRVRLKGLYVSQNLFRRQLQELKAAGYSSGSFDAPTDPPHGRRVIVSFDDGYVNVLRHGIQPLAEAAFTAIQFLPANLLGRANDWDVAKGEAPEPIMDNSQVREWLAAGHDIGSHTCTHPFLTSLTPADAAEEISASKKRLEDTFGRPINHFCYPYGDWNPAVRDMVEAAGYRTACITESGMNSAATDRFGLKRFTARYASRNWAWARGLLTEMFQR